MPGVILILDSFSRPSQYSIESAHFTFLVAIWAQQWSDNVVTGVLTIAGFTAGILLGVFLLALSPWRVGEPGVLCGIVCGLSVVSYAKFGTEIPWTWFALIGAITTVGMGWFTSLFWSGGNGRE